MNKKVIINYSFSISIVLLGPFGWGRLKWGLGSSIENGGVGKFFLRNFLEGELPPSPEKKLEYVIYKR